MSQTLLSPTIITKEALRLLLNNLVMAKSINRQYDDYYANAGASPSGKIGPSLRIRMPNRYTVRTGAPIQLQDTAETYQTLTVSTLKGVDLYFTSVDRTLVLDEFSARYLAPAMAQLANEIDYDILQNALDVYNCVGTYSQGVGASGSKAFLNAGALMDWYGAPRDNERYSVIGPDTQAGVVEALKGLFQSSSAISEQYNKGEMGTGLGFTFKMDQNIGQYTVGTRTASSNVTVDGTQTEGASTLLVAGTGSRTILKGDRFQVQDCYGVNPMSRKSIGKLQWFVATADATEPTSGHYSVPISPALISTGAYQTISVLPTNGKTVTFYGTASGNYPMDLCFQKDAFTLVTADLELPEGVDFKSRQSAGNISMRIVRAYDINNNQYPCRIDILYATKCIRPELACVVAGNVA